MGNFELDASPAAAVADCPYYEVVFVELLPFAYDGGDCAFGGVSATDPSILVFVFVLLAPEAVLIDDVVCRYYDLGEGGECGVCLPEDEFHFIAAFEEE